MSASASSSSESRDPTSSAWRLFAVPAVLAVVGYTLFYAVDAWLRVRRGPWEVTFDCDTNGTPRLRLQHSSLGLSNVQVRFLGETLSSNVPPLPLSVRFDQPHPDVPFGRTAFDDLMYLPGTVVLQCFGHEVQMLPRTLYLDRQPCGWTNNTVHELSAGTKPASLEPPPRQPGFRR